MILFVSPRRRRLVIKVLFICISFSFLTWWLISHSLITPSGNELYNIDEENIAKLLVDSKTQERSFARPKVEEGKLL